MCMSNNRLQFSIYHSSLRVSAAVCALLLLFTSGLFVPQSAMVSNDFVSYMSANVVGVGASVQPNEYNMITAALTARETELDRRENMVAQREIASQVDRSRPESQSVLPYINAAILFILLLLIVLNYALDYMRQRQVAFSNS